MIMTGFPFLNTVLTLDSVIDRATSEELFKMDNKGSIWLRSNFPHLMSQLDALTQGWSLIPKAILRNAEILKQMVESYRKNLNYGLSDDVPKSEWWVWQSKFEELLSFLETTVYAELQKMPDDRKEVETDAFAEAFAEDDSGADGGESGEEEG